MSNFDDDAIPQIQSSEFLADSHRAIMNSVDLMTFFNHNRLFWVWGSGLISTMIDLIPSDYSNMFNLDEATQALDALGQHTGRTSWILYYLRFSFNLLSIFTAALIEYEKEQLNADLNEAEKKEFLDFLLIQLNQKKFDLLNDFVWGIANMVCFIWLTAKAGLSCWGDYLTLVLLLFDVSITIWDFSEQEAAHETTMQAFTHQINALDQSSVAYQSQYQELIKKQAQCKKDWESQQADLIRNIIYAVALVLAFVVVILGVVAPPLAIAGTILCFVLTIGNNFINVGVDLNNAYSAKEDALDEWRADKENKELQQEINYRDDMISFKILQIAPVVLPQLIIPPLIFVALLLSPSGVVFPVVVSILVLTAILSVAASLLLKKYEPNRKEYSNAFLPSPKDKECPKLDWLIDSSSESFYPIS